MRILEINKFHFAKGGADKNFLDTVELLEKSGHEVAVFCMHHEKNLPSIWEQYFLSKVGYTKEYSLGQIIRGVGRMFYSWEAKRKINRLLDDFQPELVHIHNIYHQLSPIILFEIKKRGIPIIMTVHDYKLVSPNYNLFHKGEMYKGGKGRRFYQCILDRCIDDSLPKSVVATLEMYWHEWLGTYHKNVDLYIAPSNFVKKVLVEYGIKKNKVIVLGHGMPQEKLQEQSCLELSGEKYAFYFGRIAKGKGLETLFRIFSQQDSMKLYVAGAIENGIDLAKAKNVYYLGYLGHEALNAYIKNAAFVISASRLPETYGLVALESILQGTPFLGFDSGAFGEIIENGENGFLANDETELEGLVGSLASGAITFDREAIKKEAQESHNSAVYLEKLLQAFKSVEKKPV